MTPRKDASASLAAEGPGFLGLLWWPPPPPKQQESSCWCRPRGASASWRPRRRGMGGGSARGVPTLPGAGGGAYLGPGTGWPRMRPRPRVRALGGRRGRGRGGRRGSTQIGVATPNPAGKRFKGANCQSNPI
ncbi:hypothetical protein PVAP13_6NG122703 [Panicum virgatum]|uniref:Uncharacterized protein n=1 Tax=Panicum virgatum TaxID=38727 RepID=A0A8T0R0H9_PANVG|nr:hypothetical protein PVAP13_6NG122703 [Panicum virgatum]